MKHLSKVTLVTLALIQSVAFADKGMTSAQKSQSDATLNNSAVIATDTQITQATRGAGNSNSNLVTPSIESIRAIARKISKDSGNAVHLLTPKGERLLLAGGEHVGSGSDQVHGPGGQSKNENVFDVAIPDNRSASLTILVPQGSIQKCWQIFEQKINSGWARSGRPCLNPNQSNALKPGDYFLRSDDSAFLGYFFHLNSNEQLIYSISGLHFKKKNSDQRTVFARIVLPIETNSQDELDKVKMELLYIDSNILFSRPCYAKVYSEYSSLPFNELAELLLQRRRACDNQRDQSEEILYSTSINPEITIPVFPGHTYKIKWSIDNEDLPSTLVKVP